MTERQRLETAIAALEAQRESLGNTVVDASIAALRKQITDLEPQDERRKLVTVLFADLVGWTRMSEQMDPEDVAAVQQAYFQAVTPIIQQHGGRVEKYIGDAVLAVFGVPHAREDDPEQAVRTALEMQSALEELNTTLKKQQGLVLSMRVGVHTGLVFSTIDKDGDFVVTGDTVNLASRLESSAPPGGVLISKEAYRHLEDLFMVEALEPLVVKGKTDPVPVYLVKGTKPRPFQSHTRGVAGVKTRMVGRGAELLMLQNSLQDVMADGELRLITLSAEAGLGKSRLLYEFELWVDVLPEELWYFKGRASPDTERQPYGLLREVLASRFDITESDSLQEVHRKLLHGLMATGGEAEALGEPDAQLIGQLLGYDFSYSPAVNSLLDDPRHLREQALTALASYFRALSEEDPLLILLEDLHWADDNSLDALNHLAQALADRAIFVLATARPSLFQRRPHWGEGWVFQDHLDLRPLSKRASRQLVEEILQRVEQVPADLERLIVNGAEGNPFYVEELVKMLLDDGVIDASVGRWQVNLSRLEKVQIPTTLTGVLQARLDRLEVEERHVLQQASVIGSVFWNRAVLACGGVQDPGDEDPLQALQAVLQNLRVREFVYRRESSTFEDALEHTFKHAMLRDVTYESVLKRLRKVYHGLVADWLIEHTGERIGEYTGLIADHLEQAGRNHEAVEYLLQAADQARILYAYQEAVERYQRALDILVTSDAYSKAARVQMKLGLTHLNAFNHTEARGAFDRSFTLWRKAAEAQPAEPPPPAVHPFRQSAVEPPTIDPTLSNDTDSSQIIKQLFCGLVQTGPEWEVVPDLAQSWEISNDGCKYTFHLKENVYWSDGVPVTAMDFEYAWKRQLDPGHQSHSASLLYIVKHARASHKGELDNPEKIGIYALDDVTLVVELEEPAGHFLHLLAHETTFAVPRHIIMYLGESWTTPEKIVTNGPFLLKTWKRGELMILERNPRYHDVFRGNLRLVELHFSTDWSSKLAMYSADKLDRLSLLELDSMQDRERTIQRYADDYLVLTIPWSYYIGLNCSKPPFDDPRVRKALAWATDKEALSNVDTNGYIFPATGGFVPPGIPGHSTSIGLPYDPEKARELLAEAGYPGGSHFPIVETVARSTEFAHIFEFLEEHWRENLGIKINWNLLEWQKFMDADRRGLSTQMYSIGWVADYPDPDSFLRVGLHRIHNWCQNGDFKKLLDKARRTPDQPERMQLYQQADRILIHEAPIIPLFYARWPFLVKPWVTGYVEHWTFHSLKDLVIEPH